MAKITPESCRAARQLLGWKQVDLARAVGVSIASIKKFELGGTNLIPVVFAALDRAFDEAGVELFTEDESGGVGARLRHHRRTGAEQS